MTTSPPPQLRGILFSAYDKINTPFLRNRKRFPNFVAFKKYVDAVTDKEWSARIAIVNWSGDRTESYIETIRECYVDLHEAGNFIRSLAMDCTDQINNSFNLDVIFSTAHKAKGIRGNPGRLHSLSNLRAKRHHGRATRGAQFALCCRYESQT